MRPNLPVFFRKIREILLWRTLNGRSAVRTIPWLSPHPQRELCVTLLHGGETMSLHLTHKYNLTYE